MDRKELLQHLIHKKMEAKALLEVYKILDVKKYEKDLDTLLDRINEIDKIITELEKE